LNEELSQLKTKHSELQRNIETERALWLNDKKTLEDTIVDMSTSEKHLETDRTLRESTARELEERAKVSLLSLNLTGPKTMLLVQAAEERYTHEVVAHAESIKAVDNLKQQLSAANTAMRDHQAAAETAQANLATSEGSWKQQKDTLTKEVADLTAR
jgi:nucleoprotein TPR